MRLPRYLLALTLAACFSASAAEPRLGVERSISALTFGSSPGSKSSFAAASDGNDFLVAWDDFRSGRPQVIGTRLSPSGEIRDPLGIVISSAPPRFNTIAVAWNGTAYEVMYSEQNGGRRWVVLVGRDGLVSEPRPYKAGEKIWPRNENGESIVTLREGNKTTLWFEGADKRWRARTDISEWGTPLDIFPIENDQWAGFFETASGGYWVLLSKAAGVVKSLRMTPAAQEGEFVFHKFAADGQNVGVLWWTRRGAPAAGDRVGWTMVDAGGNLSTGPLDSDLPENAVVLGGRAVLSDGEAFHFATEWRDEDGEIHLRVFRLSDGTISVAEDVTPGGYSSPQFAGGQRNLIVWRRSSTVATDVIVQLFDRGGSPREEDQTALSRAAAYQESVRGATGPAGTLITWRELNAGVTLRARLMPDDRPPLEPFTVSAGAEVRSPIVAASGGIYAIIWLETEFVFKSGEWQWGARRLLMRRYDSLGIPLGPSPIVLNTRDMLSFDIAARADGFQVVWNDPVGFLWTVFVSADGTVTPSTGAILVAIDARYSQVRALSAGESALILWSEVDRPDSNVSTRTWRIVRVSPGGSLGAPFTLASLADRDRYELLPTAAASDGNRLRFFWPVERKGLPCVATRLFSLDGLPLGFIDTIGCGTFPRFPNLHASWDGERWWLAASSPAYWWVSTPSPDRVIAYAISDAGTSVTEIEVDLPMSFSLDPFLVRTSTGMMMFYTRPDEAGGKSQRGFMRSLTATPRTRAARH